MLTFCHVASAFEDIPPKGSDQRTDCTQSNGETGVNSTLTTHCVGKYVIMQTLLVECDFFDVRTLYESNTICTNI